MFRASFRDLKDANPDIHVRLQMIPWTAAHEKVLTAYAGDSTPDLCQWGNTWIPEMHLLEAIEPLDSRVSVSKVIHRGGYFPGIWETNRIDSVLYGIPWYVDTRVLFYRKDLLARAGYRGSRRKRGMSGRKLHRQSLHPGRGRKNTRCSCQQRNGLPRSSLVFSAGRSSFPTAGQGVILAENGSPGLSISISRSFGNIWLRLA